MSRSSLSLTSPNDNGSSDTAIGIIKPPGNRSKNVRKVLNLLTPQYKAYRVSI